MTIESESLADRLREGPVATDLLWRLYWGGSERAPAILETIANDLLGFERPGHVLVSGRYGSGKTSFVEALRSLLARAETPPLQLFLTMPLVTANTGTSPVAAIVGAIAESLCGPLPIPLEGRTEPGPLGEDACCRDLLGALDDLWSRENGCLTDCAPESTREAPRPNRMAGMPGRASSRVLRSNVIEHLIDRCLGWHPGDPSAPPGRILIVYLDDVDRCARDVPAAVVGLLLRFRVTRGVRFAITCDRQLMARGVADWMAANGTDDDGRAFVTANSALEKYLNLIVDLPSLGDRPLPGSAPQGLVALDRDRLELLGTRLVAESGLEPEPLMRSRRGDERDRPTLGEYLLTWLLTDTLEAGDMILEQPDLPSAAASLANGPEGVAAQTTGAAGETAEASVQPAPHQPDGEGATERGALAPHAEPSGGYLPLGLSEKDTSASTKIKVSETKEAQEKTEPAVDTNIMRRNLTHFAQDLRELVDVDPALGLLRLRPLYRNLGGSLTPRQLKFYLRSLLSGTTRDEGTPAEKLLKQIFYDFYRVRKEEPDLFRYVSASARAAMHPGIGASSRDVALFLGQVRALSGASTILGETRLESAWPEQRDERVLLLALLATIHDEDPLRAGAGPAYPSPASGTGVPTLSGGRDPEFAEWVREIVGRAPEGDLVTTQVTSFQEYVLDARRRGDSGMAAWVAEYADRFLPRQSRYLAQKNATNLSNLAVLIDDVEPFEAQCDRLFSEAVRLDPSRSGIPLYYAELLGNVAANPARRARLVPKPYRNVDALVERGERLVESASVADPKGLFYIETLKLRFAKGRGASRTDMVASLRDLVRRSAALFLQTARGGDTEPFRRLDSAMDQLLGQTYEFLPDKARIFAVLWGILERCRSPAWPAPKYLANNYVGQSQSESAAERLGLRINLWLLSDPEFISTEPDEAALVWTQTLRFWSRTVQTFSGTAASRGALGLLAALVYGGGRNWGVRAADVWQRLTGETLTGPQGLVARLDADQASLLKALEADRTGTDKVLKAVFAEDIGDPIRTVAELAAEETWTDWPEIEREIVELAGRHCPKTTEASA